MSARRGQAAVEYVVALALLLGVAAVAWHLVGASVKASARSSALVGCEYP